MQHETTPAAPAPSRPAARRAEHNVQQQRQATTAQQETSTKPGRELETRPQTKSLAVAAAPVAQASTAQQWLAIDSIAGAMVALALGLVIVGAAIVTFAK